MNLKLLLTSVLASGLAFAQSDVIRMRVPAPGDSSLPRTIYFNPSADTHVGAAEFVRGEFGSFATVKGAPYSAEATTESVQVLQDGNRIVHRDTTTLARDSEGRTRRDMSPVLPGVSGVDAPKFSFLFDPTTNTSYTLNHNKRTANKTVGKAFSIQLDHSGPAVAGTKVEAGTVAGVTASSGATIIRKMEHTEVIEGPVVAGMPAVAAMSVVRLDGRDSKARVEQLGKQVMEGVAVEGTRTVTTIPAGEIGNERPIEIVNERWYSPELQMVVMSKHSDPRQGETTYRLTNLRRQEPDKSLFELPAGYSLETIDIRGPKLRQAQPKD